MDVPDDRHGVPSQHDEPPPDQPDLLTTQLAFVVEIDRLKSVLRQSTLCDGSRRENSAEHSWHLAVMATVLGEYAPPGTDLARVVTMVLLHDVVEVDAGDLYVYADAAAQRRQEAAEQAAADRIFGLLPREQATRLRALWEEFERRVTPEARFARALDRLQPLLCNYQSGGGSWRAHGIAADQVLANVTLIEDGSAALGEYARRLVADAVSLGYLAPPRSEGESGGDRRRVETTLGRRDADGVRPDRSPGTVADQSEPRW